MSPRQKMIKQKLATFIGSDKKRKIIPMGRVTAPKVITTTPLPTTTVAPIIETTDDYYFDQ